MQAAGTGLTALAAVAALLFTGLQSRQAGDELQLTREAQVTERFSKAVEQLGSDSMELRVGGIYALQRIMQDSPRDQSAVVRVLTAFFRSHAQSKGHKGPRSQGMADGRADVVACVGVLTHRVSTRDTIHDDFSDGYLVGADLRGADLSEDEIVATDLTSAQLASADLDGADFFWTRLDGADLRGVSARKTIFSDMSLEDADLRGAHLEGALFSGANLDQADLRNTTGLTVTQLLEANILTSTRLPTHLANNPRLQRHMREVERDYETGAI